LWAMPGEYWEVVGGAEKGGILVRQGVELKSPEASARLFTGSIVEQLALEGERLQYKLLTGWGPEKGWVSIQVSGKELLRRKAEPLAPTPPAEPASRIISGPGSGMRHRWAVNIDEWMPEGQSEGREFQFLLGLIDEEDRKSVMKFKFEDDRKRALLSRMLIRQASASALRLTNWRDIVIKRTKGRKPFLASPLPPEEEAPNWNVNVSHEGSWVVCASEPLCLVGVDVAELRRYKPNGQVIEFHKHFKDNLTETEWDSVNSAGASLDAQYEVFSRYWAAKEAFVKARGDGIAYPLGQADFRWVPIKEHPEGTSFEGSVAIEGRKDPMWRFFQHRMPGMKPHWTTVARAPLTAIVDAHGEFTKTLRRVQSSFNEKEWLDALQEESNPFDVLPINALVPQDDMEAYVRAGGTPVP